MVGISETRADAETAEQFFFRHVKPGEVYAYHEGDMTMLVKKTWADDVGIEQGSGGRGPNFEVVIPGVMHALRIDTGSIRGWVFHLRLDAASEEKDIQQ